VPQPQALVRGRVYYADLGHGDKPWLVVSNNRRNTQLESALVVRITTSVKPNLASIVELDASDPLVGRVLCDDVNVIYTDEAKRDAGALSQRTMMRVADGLRSAFAL
jgi:mRNA interferase MazF